MVVVLPCVPAIAMPSPAEHDRRQRRRPVQHPDPAPPGLDELRVVLPDRGRHHQRVRRRRRGPRSWPTCTTAPSAASSSSCCRRGRVAAGHGDPPGQQDARDPGHARAADAGEMHPAELADRHRLDRRHQRHHGIPPTGRARSGLDVSRRRQPGRLAPAARPAPSPRRGPPRPAARSASRGRCPAAAADMARDQLGVEQHRQQRVADPVRAQLGVVDDEPAAGLLDRARRSAAARRCRAAAGRTRRAGPPP